MGLKKCSYHISIDQRFDCIICLLGILDGKRVLLNVFLNYLFADLLNVGKRMVEPKKYEVLKSNI